MVYVVKILKFLKLFDYQIICVTSSWLPSCPLVWSANVLTTSKYFYPRNLAIIALTAFASAETANNGVCIRLTSCLSTEPIPAALLAFTWCIQPSSPKVHSNLLLVILCPFIRVSPTGILLSRRGTIREPFQYPFSCFSGLKFSRHSIS